jgi:uncharacterized protein YegL
MIRLLRPLRPFRLAAAFSAAAALLVAQSETTLCGFEPGAEETYSVVGPSRIETAAGFVRSGAGSLRITCAPPEERPGLRIPGNSLRGRGFRKLCCDVLNPSPRPVALVVRADGEGAASHRREIALRSGWNEVEIDLERLDTGKGGRVEPSRLVLLSLIVESPKDVVELFIDSVRGVAPGGPREDDALRGAGRRAFERFERLFAEEGLPEIKAGLILGLEPFDVPGRPAALDRAVFAAEGDARFVAEALRVFADTKHSGAVAEAIALAERASGRRRLRWCEALASLRHEAADEYCRRILATRGGSEAATVLTTRARRPSPELLPVLGADLGGGWQLECARIRVLRGLAPEVAFGPLTDHLRAESGRTRADAREALEALVGRDLGEDPTAWRAWRAAHATKAAPESRRYGVATYYGIPLLPGRLCFVLDVSGSMHEALHGAAADYAAKNGRVKNVKVPTRLDLAREELGLAIQALDTRAVFHVVYFNGSVQEWTEGPLTATKDNKERALRALKRLGASGSTDLHGGLTTALDPADDAAENFRKSFDAIYLLSDGQPTAGRLQETSAILADVADRNRGRLVRVHTVGLGDADCTLLRELAKLTQGVFVDLAR